VRCELPTRPAQAGVCRSSVGALEGRPKGHVELDSPRVRLAAKAAVKGVRTRTFRHALASLRVQRSDRLEGRNDTRQPYEHRISAWALAGDAAAAADCKLGESAPKQALARVSATCSRA
jgi:hypothetical protein